MTEKKKFSILCTCYEVIDGANVPVKFVVVEDPDEWEKGVERLEEWAAFWSIPEEMKEIRVELVETVPTI